MIRDEELKRLVKYAQGHNIKVTFKPYVPRSMDAGYCSTDGRDITLAIIKGTSKLQLILTLIHELGHALYNINNNERVPDEKLEAALDDEKAKKKHRKVILTYERKSAEWWDIIYRDADLKFPKWRLDMQKEYDIWQYECWHRFNRFPTKEEKHIKWSILKDDYYGK